MWVGGWVGIIQGGIGKGEGGVVWREGDGEPSPASTPLSLHTVPRTAARAPSSFAFLSTAANEFSDRGLLRHPALRPFSTRCRPPAWRNGRAAAGERRAARPPARPFLPPAAGEGPPSRPPVTRPARPAARSLRGGLGDFGVQVCGAQLEGVGRGKGRRSTAEYLRNISESRRSGRGGEGERRSRPAAAAAPAVRSRLRSPPSPRAAAFCRRGRGAATRGGGGW